ncbi:MAG: tRNA (adenosine(37)-N6)-threonylcarbamoyltransferase complex ATPase subunit type 1 TsaE [Desulfobacterota bacterium]|nr:tRNA (adenosine(37)-N6)-threonylcarbamoyltransferase complex ATPase subunit type 1 TsaE [Thermodesulfobacteriota bacterium]
MEVLVNKNIDCLIFTTFNPEETEIIGKRVGEQFHGGEGVSLRGELGSGKTCFTRGIARGLGINNQIPVVSPSFTLINEYPGKIPLYHFDFYRIDEVERIFDLGYEEYFYGRGVTVIEWGEKIAQFLPPEHMKVFFIMVEDETRQIRIKARGERFIDILQTFKK